MSPPSNLHIAILNTVDVESVHGEVVFNPSPEVDDGMKLRSVTMNPQPAEKQDKMV